MPFVSVSCAHSSPAHCLLYICLCLSFLLTSTLITVSDQMLRCAELQFDAESASAWDYCVHDTPATRNWYQAMAACRSFGGELVSLEWLQKIKNIQERLSEFGVNLSSGVFVNAHRPFYSANNRFAWSSGIELPLEVDTTHMEQCVKYSSIGMLPITCYTDIEVFPLLCQRVSPRKAGISELKSLLLPNLNSYKLTFKSINYSVESCDYFSFIRADYNWYQAKMLCETVNSELLGIPRNEECQLVDECLNLRVKSKPPKLMLNMHLKMYARNGSLEIFRDPSGKIINDSNCSWSDTVKYEYNDAEEKYCVCVEQSKTISQFKCINKDTTDFVGVICRQCRPNSNYPYIRRRVFKRSTESTWMTFIQTQSLASNQSLAITQFLAPIGHSGFSMPVPLLNLILLSLSVLFNAMLVVALVLCLLSNRRTRVASSLPTAFRPDSNPRPASYDYYDIEHLRDEGEWDTGEINTPPMQPPPQPPGQTYANYEYSESTEFVESGDTRVGSGAVAQTRLLSNLSTNEPHRPSGEESTYLQMIPLNPLTSATATEAANGAASQSAGSGAGVGAAPPVHLPHASSRLQPLHAVCHVDRVTELSNCGRTNARI